MQTLSYANEQLSIFLAQVFDKRKLIKYGFYF
jgi:hypothetical protein